MAVRLSPFLSLNSYLEWKSVHEALSVCTYGMPAAIDKALIGLNLLGVNLNQVFMAMAPESSTGPSHIDLAHAETVVKIAGEMIMQEIPCNQTLEVFRLVAKCGFFVAGGDTHFGEVNPMNMTLSEYVEFHSNKFPLLSVLALTEGDLDGANSIIDGGVDFAAVSNLNMPKCDVFQTPDFIFASSYPTTPWETRLRAFQVDWGFLAMFLDTIPSIYSQLGDESKLTNNTRNSVKRIALAAKQHMLGVYHSNSRFRVKFVAAACKTIQLHAMYGISGTVVFERKLVIDEVILPNIGVPGEYFSAFISYLPV